MGGADVSMPFWRDASGGSSTVVILEVEETNFGSEISCLLIDRFRAAGPRGGAWKACAVGVLLPDPTGEGCAGVGFITKGAVGDGRGDNGPSPARIGCRLCASKKLLVVTLLLLRDLPAGGIIGDGIGDGWNCIAGVPGDLGPR